MSSKGPRTLSDFGAEPGEAQGCSALGCRETDDVEPVTDGCGRTRTLCPRHAKHFMQVTS